MNNYIEEFLFSLSCNLYTYIDSIFGIFVPLGTIFIIVAACFLTLTPVWKFFRADKIAYGLVIICGAIGFFLIVTGKHTYTPNEGMLTVYAEPEGSDIFLTGKRRMNYQPNIKLGAGQYTVSVNYTDPGNKQYKKRSKKIAIKACKHTHVYMRVLPSLNIMKPQIVGNAIFQNKTNKALKLLANSKSSAHRKVRKHVDTIEHDNSKKMGMMTRFYRMYESNATFIVNDTLKSSTDIAYAGSIAHDAFHASQFDNVFAGTCAVNDKRSYIRNGDYKKIEIKSPNYVCGYPLVADWNSCGDLNKVAKAEIEASKYQLNVLKSMRKSSINKISREEAAVQCNISVVQGKHCNPKYKAPCFYYTKDDRYVNAELNINSSKDNILIEFSLYDFLNGPFCKSNVKIGLRLLEDNKMNNRIGITSWKKYKNTQYMIDMKEWAVNYIKSQCAGSKNMVIALLISEDGKVEEELPPIKMN